MHSGHTGTSLGGTERTPARAKRDAARRRAEDRSFAARNGAVTVRYACICPRGGCKLHPDV